ncbi:MAG: NADPH-dependent FMN reductase [Ilumatobacteraceae bacterium]
MSFRVLALCGSLRSGSSNRGLLAIARRVAPAGIEIDEFPIGDLPFYNADLEREGVEPLVVAAFRQRVRDCDAVLIATPEYNGHLPAVLKNAFDWATKPNPGHALSGKVVTSMASGGGGGGAKALQYLDTVIPFFGNTVVTEPRVELKKGAEVLAADGTTSHPEIESLIRDRLAALLAELASR